MFMITDKFYWFLIFVSANAIFLSLLAFNVSRLRLKNKISYGDGGNKDVLKAMRAHANGVEQVPIFALLLLSLTISGLSQGSLAILTILFTLSRVSHAVGMLTRIFIARRIGAATTYLLQLLASFVLAYQVFM